MKIALALSAATLALVAMPADAQRAPRGERGQPQAAPASTVTTTGGRTLALSKEARPAIAALKAAVDARDAAAFATALPAAQAAAKNVDDRYAIASLRYQFVQGGTDKAAQLAAIEGLIEAGGATPSQLAQYHRAIGQLAFDTGKFDRAAQAFAEVDRLQPNDPEVLSNLSIIHIRRGKEAEALAAIQRAVEAQRALGQPVSQDWLKNMRSLASRQKNNPLTLKANYDLLAAYPTAENWRDGLQLHQSLVPLDETGELDRLRLMRATGALHGERAYRYMAEVLLQRGFSGEAKAVLDEGVAKNQVNRSEPTFAALIRQANTKADANRGTLASAERGLTTARQFQGIADANYGFGNYTKAAELYRRALAAGGGDPSLLNLRLGMALAQAGDKAGAQTAFNSVTTGPRADLARYWLLWTNGRA